MKKATGVVLAVLFMIIFILTAIMAEAKSRHRGPKHGKHGHSGVILSIPFPLPPPLVIIIKPRPHPIPHPEPYPYPPSPPQYHQVWVPGGWETVWEYDPYTGRYYQKQVWRPGYWEYRRF